MDGLLRMIEGCAVCKHHNAEALLCGMTLSCIPFSSTLRISRNTFNSWCLCSMPDLFPEFLYMKLYIFALSHSAMAKYLTANFSTLYLMYERNSVHPFDCMVFSSKLYTPVGRATDISRLDTCSIINYKCHTGSLTAHVVILGVESYPGSYFLESVLSSYVLECLIEHELIHSAVVLYFIEGI